MHEYKQQWGISERRELEDIPQQHEVTFHLVK